MQVLGLDLGMVNFGYSITTNKITESGYLESIVVENGLLIHTIQQLKSGAEFKLDLNSFISEFENIIQNNSSIELVVIERFMDRSSVARVSNKPIALNTITMETTNIMLGVLTTILTLKYPNIEILVIGASTWKNSFNKIRKNANVDELKELYKICNAQEHCVDATLQAIYGANKKLGIRQFEMFQDNYKTEELLVNIENTTKAKITKRRKKKTYF